MNNESLNTDVHGREPLLNVGVMEGLQIFFSVGEREHAMTYLGEERMFDEVDCSPTDAEKREIVEYWSHAQPFTLKNVTIGKQFHWEQQEDQVFNGSLHIIARDGELHAINVVPVEEYLKSVISSEMSATNSLELLKTHAIISRSWVLRQLQLKKNLEQVDTHARTLININPAEHRIVKWWDHDDHQLFDVCADDHCQRYQGITRQVSSLVAQAVEETRGMVLLDRDGNICDARFSKCCGGRTETFDTCWQEQSFHYLQSVECKFCNTKDERVLRLVLNDYDQKTRDFHRWRVEYSEEEISDIFERKTQLGIGKILELEPLKRGTSGRIEFLKVVGSEKTVEVGKELMIRKALSETHLYSSAFEIKRDRGKFVLEGMGWGHGVGLCQIGAACMSVEGFSHRRILAHYFQGAKIECLY